MALRKGPMSAALKIVAEDAERALVEWETAHAREYAALVHAGEDARLAALDAEWNALRDECSSAWAELYDHENEEV